jgi:glutathione S-transferase
LSDLENKANREVVALAENRHFVLKATAKKTDGKEPSEDHLRSTFACRKVWYVPTLLHASSRAAMLSGSNSHMAAAANPILYSFRRCPYAMRARLALAVSGIRHELREVRLADKPAAMLLASAKGSVPVLVLPDGRVIDESLDIMRWALAVADPEMWLARNDPALIAINDGAFKQDLDRYKYPERHGADPAAHRESGLVFLRALDRRLMRASQLCGPARGFADAAIMPFVRQFAAVDGEWFDAQPLAHLKTWLHGHLISTLFDTIMVRVPAWTPGTPPVMVVSISSRA